MSDFADFERKTKNEPRYDEEAEVTHLSGAQAAFTPSDAGAPDDNGPEASRVEQHIITHLNEYLPELYEFFLRGENERYIRVGDLDKLRHDIRDIIKKITSQKESVLPKDIVRMLSALRYRNNPDSIYNPFGEFLGAYISFRERHGYGESRSLPRLLLNANTQKQGAVDKHYQRVVRINLLASRLSRYLAKTFELLDRATRMDLRPWSEQVNSARGTILNQLFPVDPDRYNRLIVETRATLSENKLATLKLNHLAHAQRLETERQREKAHVLRDESAPAQNIQPSTLSVLLPFGDEDLDSTGDNNRIEAGTDAASMTGALALILQGIKLTQDDARALSASAPTNKQGDGNAPRQDNTDSQFVKLIVLACDRLHPIVIALHAAMDSTLPSKKLFRDTPEKGIFHGIEKIPTKVELGYYSPHLPRSLKAPLWRGRRLINGFLTKTNTELQKVLGCHVLTQEEKAAVLLTGGIIKDKIQQTRANLLKIGQATQPLLSVWQHADALEQLLAESTTPILDDKLKETRPVWKAAIQKENDALETFIAARMELAHRDVRMHLQQQLADILRDAMRSAKSCDYLNGFLGILENKIDFLSSIEKQMEDIPLFMNDSEDARSFVPEGIKQLERALQESDSTLNLALSRLTGQEPGSFSRTGMLAKGIAGLQLKWKREWLQNNPYADPRAVEHRYDEAFEKIIGDYAPLLAKKHDSGGKMLLQRIRTEKVHAATGNTLYPATMAEILRGQKSVEDMLKSWSIRRLVKKSLYAAFGSFSFLPSLMALPLRIVFRCTITGAMATYTIHKGQQGVKLGQGGVSLEASQYKKEAFKHVAIKIGLGTIPGGSQAIGAGFLWEDIYKGRLEDAAKGIAEEVFTELVWMGGREAVKAGADAAVGKIQEILLEKEMQRFIDGLNDVKKTEKTLPSATEELFRIDDDGELAPLARRLMATGHLSRIGMGRSKTGRSYYDLKTHTVMLREGATDQEKLHEIAHALSAHQLRYAQDKEVPKRLKKEGRLEELKAHRVLRRRVKRLDRLRIRARKAYKLAGGTDGETLHYLDDLNEFVAGLYSGNSEFTRFLASIDPQGRSLLAQAVELLALLLGLDTERDSALTRAMGLSETIMGTSHDTMGRYEGKLYHQLGMNNGRGSRAANSRAPTRRAAPTNWRTWDGRSLPSSTERNSLVSWLAGLSANARNAWINQSKLSADDKKNVGIYLAENHQIFDWVSGKDYFAWLNEYKKQSSRWPADFQHRNRIVGLLRDTRSNAVFPRGKGMRFELKDINGHVLFAKIYYPQGRGSDANDPLVWHIDIFRQIERDMRMQSKDKRVSVCHINNYSSDNPSISAGIDETTRDNVFIAEENSLVSSADFRFVDAEISATINSTAQGDMSDYVAVRQYFINEQEATLEEKKTQFINSSISASVISSDKVTEANDLIIVLYKDDGSWETVELDSYLVDDNHLNYDGKMVVIAAPVDKNTWIFDPNNITQSYPQLQQLFQSENFRQQYRQLATSVVGGGSPGDISNEARENRIHSQENEHWHSSGQNIVARDLVLGEKIVVSVYREGEVIEYMEFLIPQEYLRKEVWPGYVALRVNDNMKYIRMGEVDASNSSPRIHSRAGGNNTIWTMNGETVNMAITREGNAAIYPSLNNRPWQVPNEETWPETPPILDLPALPESDQQVVVWVEDRRTGQVVEWLGIPSTYNNTPKAFAEMVNSRASHVRVGDLTQGVITPTAQPGRNIFWVDNENYMVKYSVTPNVIYDKNLQLIQKYQLLELMKNNPEETRLYLRSENYHPFYALSRAEIVRIIALSPENVRDERTFAFSQLESLKIHPDAIANIDQVTKIREIIKEASAFRSQNYSYPAVRNSATLFNYAKTDALRFMLSKYPAFAISANISLATASHDDLLKAIAETYPVMTVEQQEEYNFINALYWNLSQANQFAITLPTRVSSVNLDIFSLRKEIMDIYYESLAGRSGVMMVEINPRVSFNNAAYYQQFNYYTNTGLSFEESEEIQDPPPEEQSSSGIQTHEYLDKTILKMAWAHDLKITKEDLDIEYNVKFRTTTVNAPGTLIAPNVTYHTKRYTLREILLGNIFRDESSSSISISEVSDIEGVDGLTIDVLDEIIEDINAGLKTELEKLKYSSEFRQSTKDAYNRILSGVLLEILQHNQSPEVLEIINQYISGHAKLKTVSVTKPDKILGVGYSYTTYPVPGMVALRGGSKVILISLDKGTYYIVGNDANEVNYNVATAISGNLSKKDFESIEYTEGRRKWPWKLTYGTNVNISQKDIIMDKLFNRAMRKLLADFDYHVYDPTEKKRDRLVTHGKTLLQAGAIIAGVVATGGTGIVASTALLLGIVAEATDIGLSVVKMNNADRGKDYLEARSELFIGAILFATFGVADVIDLLKIAVKSRREFISAVKTARKIADEIKQGDNAAGVFARDTPNPATISGYSERIIDAQLNSGAIDQTRHDELMSSLRERNAGVTTLSPTNPSGVTPQPYVRSQWQAGTPQLDPVAGVNIQVDSNGPWRLAHTPADQPDTLTVFSHGKYFSSKPTTAVPDGIEIQFVTPHDTAASVPGERSFMHDEITPFATVNKKKFKVSTHRDPQKTEPVPLTELRDKLLGPGKKPKVSDNQQRVLATGTDQSGSVINYLNQPFNPDKGTGNYVESDFVRFVGKNRVAQNSDNHAVIKPILNIPDSQSFTPAPKTDFLFLHKDSSHGLTSEVLEIAKEKGYKKVRLVHCRVERGKENTAIVYQINPYTPKEKGSLAGSDEQLYTVEFDLENDTIEIIPMIPVSAVAKTSELEETDSEH